jgi:uncharacterized coiled-coil protein SlyX
LQAIQQVFRKQIHLEKTLHEQEVKIAFYENIVRELQYKQNTLEENLRSLNQKRDKLRYWRESR